MVRRRLAVVLLALAPALAGCPAQAGSAPGAAPATAPPAAPAAPAPAGWAAEMLGLVNTQRAAAGLGPLSMCGTLGVAAQRHTEDQASHSSMTHTGSDGSDIGTRATRAGYRNWTTLGENVAYGYGTPAAVMAGWMASSGHRANILGATYTHVGFGAATSTNGTPYWTQDFGRSGTC